MKMMISMEMHKSLWRLELRSAFKVIKKLFLIYPMQLDLTPKAGYTVSVSVFWSGYKQSCITHK